MQDVLRFAAAGMPNTVVLVFVRRESELFVEAARCLIASRDGQAQSARSNGPRERHSLAYKLARKPLPSRLWSDPHRDQLGAFAIASLMAGPEHCYKPVPRAIVINRDKRRGALARCRVARALFPHSSREALFYRVLGGKGLRRLSESTQSNAPKCLALVYAESPNHECIRELCCLRAG